MQGTKWGLGLQAEKCRAPGNTFCALSEKFSDSTILPKVQVGKNCISERREKKEQTFFVVTKGETVRKMLQRRLCENLRQFTEPSVCFKIATYTGLRFSSVPPARFCHG